MPSKLTPNGGSSKSISAKTPGRRPAGPYKMLRRDASSLDESEEEVVELHGDSEHQQGSDESEGSGQEEDDVDEEDERGQRQGKTRQIRALSIRNDVITI